MKNEIENALYKEEVTSVSTIIVSIIMVVLAAYFLWGVISELLIFLHDPFTWAVFAGLSCTFLVPGIVLLLRRKLKITITSEAIILAFMFKPRTVLFNGIQGYSIDEELIKSYGGQGIRVRKIDGKRALIYNSTKSPRVILDFKDGEYEQLVFSTKQPEKIASILADRIK